MYLYEGHMGGIYPSETELNSECLYCEQCGDSDWLIGNFNNFSDAYNCLVDDDGPHRYTPWYVLQELGEIFFKGNYKFLDRFEISGCYSTPDKIILTVKDKEIVIDSNMNDEEVDNLIKKFLSLYDTIS